MRMKAMLIAATLAATLTANNSLASTMFSDEFVNGASGNWTVTEPAANVSYTNGRAYFNGSGDNNRNYLRTVDADYAAVDFVATVRMSNGPGNGGCGFFGIGDGVQAGNYGEPMTGAGENGKCIYFLYRGAGGADELGRVQHAESGDYVDIFTQDNQTAGTLLGIRLTWTAATKTAAFSLDLDNDGVYDDGTITQVGAPVYSSASHLFVGGAGGVSVDSVSVVPEPGTLVLLVSGSIGLLATALGRKRRNGR
jgi:hypothetical protein